MPLVHRSLRGALFVAFVAVVGRSWSFTAVVDWRPVLTHVPPAAADVALARAWRVLTDFDHYGEWNSFTVGVDTAPGLPEPGSPVGLSVVLGQPWPLDRWHGAHGGPGTRLELNFTWLEFNPTTRRMCWGIRHARAPLGLGPALHRVLHSNRCAELRHDEGTGEVQVRHTDENVGALAPLGSCFGRRSSAGSRR